MFGGGGKKRGGGRKGERRDKTSKPATPRGKSSGRSTKETTIFGKEYVQHRDKNGKKTGTSWKEPNWFGKDKTVHRDETKRKTGESRRETTWTGKEYTQHYDADGRKKTGSSKAEQTLTGKSYTEHLDARGKQAGRSYTDHDIFGNEYRDHRDGAEGGRPAASSISSSSQTSGLGAGSSSSFNARSTPSHAGLGGATVAIGVLVLVGAVAFYQQVPTPVTPGSSGPITTPQVETGPATVLPAVQTQSQIDSASTELGATSAETCEQRLVCVYASEDETSKAERVERGSQLENSPRLASEGWYQVTLAQGRSGFIHSRDLANLTPPPSVGTNVVPPE